MNRWRRKAWARHTLGFQWRTLAVLGEADRQHLLETYYDPHRARLERAVADTLSRHGGCLIIDVHSFSSIRSSRT